MEQKQKCLLCMLNIQQFWDKNVGKLFTFALEINANMIHCTLSEPIIQVLNTMSFNALVILHLSQSNVPASTAPWNLRFLKFMYVDDGIYLSNLNFRMRKSICKLNFCLAPTIYDWWFGSFRHIWYWADFYWQKWIWTFPFQIISVGYVLLFVSLKVNILFDVGCKQHSQWKFSLDIY